MGAKFPQENTHGRQPLVVPPPPPKPLKTVRQWQGDPVFDTPSACRDARNTWRVFHRDIPGRIIAEFYGNNAMVMAEKICKLFGKEWKRENKDK